MNWSHSRCAGGGCGFGLGMWVVSVHDYPQYMAFVQVSVWPATVDVYVSAIRVSRCFFFLLFLFAISCMVLCGERKLSAFKLIEINGWKLICFHRID